MRSETSFNLTSNLIWVDALLVGPTGRANVQLVFDTGAALTTLVPSIAESIGFSAATGLRRTVTRTAAAAERGYLAELSEISTLGVTVPALLVNVSDLGYGVAGVLGMNFLRKFNIEIRPAERRILVENITLSR
jgi:predicted aspartyl protease